MVTKTIVVALVAGLALVTTAAAQPNEHANERAFDGRGGYVEYDLDGSTIANYTLVRGDAERVVFTSIELPSAPEDVRERGRVTAARGEDYRLAAFDARNGALFIQAKNATTITFVVAEGIELAYHAGEVGWSPEGVSLTDGNKSARLVVRGENASVEVDGRTITVTLGEGDNVSFRLKGHPIELLKEKWAMHRMGKEMRGEHGAGADHMADKARMKARHE